jgi:hypothetical protein
MGKWITLLLLLGFAWPAMAAKPMSIEQVEQLLAKLEGKQDGKVARELDEVQLTERVSAARLARWEAEFPGSRAHEELMALADLSAFLQPPASDVLRDPPPDTETERHILWTCEQYVGTAASHLPDLSVIRETTHFAESGSSPSRLDFFQGKAAAMQPKGTYSRTAIYRSGREVSSGTAREPVSGLAPQGEFGPILSQVLGDAVENQISFDRWEQGPTDPAAVFRYAVPASASHFEIGSANRAETFHPAYHGEIEIDPDTGAILRLSEIAEMPPQHAEESAAIEVNYALATIGGRTYICPVKGVAFSRLPAAPESCSGPTACSQGPTATANPSQWPIETFLNDVTYTHYRESPSEHTIVVNGAAGR